MKTDTCPLQVIRKTAFSHTKVMKKKNAPKSIYLWNQRSQKHEKEHAYLLRVTRAIDFAESLGTSFEGFGIKSGCRGAREIIANGSSRLL